MNEFTTEDMERATPETDAAQIIHSPLEGDVWVPADFARDLERERNIATEQWEHTIKLCRKLERERDDWRKCAEHLADALKFWVGDDRYQIGGHHESRVALTRFLKLKEAGR